MSKDLRDHALELRREREVYPTKNKSITGVHVTFVFNRTAAYPPNSLDMKVFYASKELIRRGAYVSWIQLRGESSGVHEGIEFVKVQSLGSGLIHSWFSLLGIVAFCKARGVHCVYGDDWLLFRDKPLRLLSLQLALKLAGVRFVFDQRDPYLDYEIARGKLVAGSRKHKSLLIAYKLVNRLSDLIILPSHEYAEVLVKEQGIDSEKTLGIFRGIDSAIFNPRSGSESLREELKLGDKFVVGWYGWMGPYRRIREVFVPLIRNIKNFIPNGHVLIAGDGDDDLKEEFLKLEKDGIPLTLLNFQPYEQLPNFIKACDVLICPLDNSSVHTQNTISLKIFESLAMGKPIIATRTRVEKGEYKDLRGIIWVGTDFESFVDALTRVHQEYGRYASEAMIQSYNLKEFSIANTFPKIIDQVLEKIRPR